MVYSAKKFKIVLTIAQHCFYLLLYMYINIPSKFRVPRVYVGHTLYIRAYLSGVDDLGQMLHNSYLYYILV